MGIAKETATLADFKMFFFCFPWIMGQRVQVPLYPENEREQRIAFAEREIEAWMTINNSEHVCQLLDWNKEDVPSREHIHIAMVLYPEDLAKYIDREHSTMAWQDKLGKMKDTAEAVQFLHTGDQPRGPMTHNDLKPENILLDDSGKVCVFGSHCYCVCVCVCV